MNVTVIGAASHSAAGFRLAVSSIDISREYPVDGYEKIFPTATLSATSVCVESVDVTECRL